MDSRLPFIGKVGASQAEVKVSISSISYDGDGGG